MTLALASPQASRPPTRMWWGDWWTGAAARRPSVRARFARSGFRRNADDAVGYGCNSDRYDRSGWSDHEMRMNSSQMSPSLKNALALLDLRVIDHLIVAGATILSFSERGLI